MHEDAQDCQEAKTYNGNAKPVVEMSDPPRGATPRNPGNRGMNFGPEAKGQGAMNRKGQASPRRYVPIAPKPSGNVFHFKATSTPGATVQIHAPPTPDKEITMFLKTKSHMCSGIPLTQQSVNRMWCALTSW